MQEKLNIPQFATQIKSNETFFLLVKNCTTGKVIDKNVNQAFLEGNHDGDLSQYVKSLENKGYSKIAITLRKRNGSGSFKKSDETFVNLNPLLPIKQTPSPAKSHTPIETPGLNAAGLMGLSIPQVMDGYAALKEVVTLKQRIQNLESKLLSSKEAATKAKEKNSKYERKIDIHDLEEKYNASKEPSKFDKIIDAAIANPDILPTLINSFKGMAGLNSPAPQPVQNPEQDLSELKQKVIASIRKMPEMISQSIYSILKKYATNDTEFIEDLHQLINNKIPQENG